MGSRTGGEVRRARILPGQARRPCQGPAVGWNELARDVQRAGAAAPGLLCRGVQAPRPPRFLALLGGLWLPAVHHGFPFHQPGRTAAGDVAGHAWVLLFALLPGMAPRLAHM